MDLENILREMRTELGRAKAITTTATKAERGLTAAEDAEVKKILARVEYLKAERAEAELALSKAAGIRGKVGKLDGFKALARQIVAEGRGEIRVKDLTANDSNANYSLGTIIEQGISAGEGTLYDTRYVYGLFGSSDPGTALHVTDFRMTSRGDETGSGGSGDATDLERDPLSNTEKAELDVVVEGFTADLKQEAIMVREIPNALLASDSALGSLLSSEMRKALNAALDAHVVAAIAAASPDQGGTGSSVEEKVRSGISAMRSKGAHPDVVVINPTDSEAVDLHTAIDSIVRFPYGLRVVESPDVTAGEPLLIDTSIAGHLYLAGLQAASDPYTGFSRNTTQLRAEFNCLFVVRNADGLFIADGSDGS